MGELVTPKFLTAQVAEDAVNMVIGGVLNNRLLDGIAKKERVGHIVVLVPSTEAGNENNLGAGVPEPFLLFEKSFGYSGIWTSDYKKIAGNKAMQLWHNQNTDGNTDVMPHLLFEGDTPYWGGVKRHGIVVAFSGDKPYIDQMLSGMVADAIKALARWAWENSSDKIEKKAFLT